MTHHHSQTKGFVDELNGAIRENPLAAGLIGAGFAWLLLGNRGVGSAFSAARDGAGSMGEAATAAAGRTSGSAASAWDATARSARGAAEAVGETGASIAGAASGAAQSMGSMAQGAFSSATDQVSSAASSVADYASSASRRVTRSSSEFAGTAQETLSEVMERQPLVLGAIGLAIGAGLASAFPKTRIEDELMGEASASVREGARELAGTVQSRAEEVVSEVKSEAERQGLTPAAAQEAMGDLADRAKSVAQAAAEGARGSRQ